MAVPFILPQRAEADRPPSPAQRKRLVVPRAQDVQIRFPAARTEARLALQQRGSLRHMRLRHGHHVIVRRIHRPERVAGVGRRELSVQLVTGVIVAEILVALPLPAEHGERRARLLRPRVHRVHEQTHIAPAPRPGMRAHRADAQRRQRPFADAHRHRVDQHRRRELSLLAHDKVMRSPVAMLAVELGQQGRKVVRAVRLGKHIVNELDNLFLFPRTGPVRVCHGFIPSPVIDGFHYIMRKLCGQAIEPPCAICYNGVKEFTTGGESA